MAHCITVRGDYLLTLTWYCEYLLDHLSGLVYKEDKTGSTVSLFTASQTRSQNYALTRNIIVGVLSDAMLHL
jgi:hypothetical protein